MCICLKGSTEALCSIPASEEGGLRGLRVRVWGLRFRVQGLGLYGSGFCLEGLGPFRIKGLGFMGL